MRSTPRLALAALLAASYVSAGQLVSRQTSTGDRKCFQSMCIDATVTGSEVQYVLTSTGVRPVGWMAIGWGRQMSGSDVVVVWPNSDGTFTLSQRTATGHVMPTVDSSPSRIATIQESASDVTASLPKFAFTLPVSTVGTENIIYAFGTAAPDSSSPNAEFTEHWAHGDTTINLAGTLSTATSGSSSPTSTSGSGGNTGSNNGGTSFPLTKTDRMVIAHGILCVIGFLFFLPLGGLVARYFRTSTSTWFKAHQTIQSFLAGPIIIVGWALGVAIIADGGGPHFATTHTKLGLALFVLYVVQILIGNIIHKFKPKSAAKRRPLQNYFHVFLGILIILLSFFQVRTGYNTEYPRATGRDPLPKATDIIFYIWVVVVPVLYFGGLALLPKQFRQEAASRSNVKETNFETRDDQRYGTREDQRYGTREDHRYGTREDRRHGTREDHRFEMREGYRNP